MKVLKQITLFLLIAITFGNCKDEVSTELRYMANVPIYMTRDELKAGLKSAPKNAISNPGKIYIKGKYLFINDIGKGIHVYDNSNPASPKPITYLNIPGNVDMAIKGNLMYVDNFTDLVTIDISDINNVKEVGRNKDEFPNYNPSRDNRYPVAPIDKSKGVVVGWKVEEITIQKTEDERRRPIYWYNGWRLDELSSAKFEVTAAGGISSSNVGVAGSMARFAIHGNILYVINRNFEIKVFNIDDNKITKKRMFRAGTTIETLFIKDNNLFIGSRTGMFIYDIKNPEFPNFVSQYRHVTSCDPVVVNDKYAFVTLRTGNTCNSNVNRLDIISLEDIWHPTLITSYNMHNPHGLGIDNNILFVCDGTEGLKVYDASDVNKIDQKLLQHFKNIKTYDLIPYNNTLIMTGADGIYQYDYSDIKNIHQISHIPKG